MAEHLFQFAFILLVPLVVVAGGLVTLFGVGALFDALDHPDEVGERIAAAFRASAAPGREITARHYYQPYWKG